MHPWHELPEGFVSGNRIGNAFLAVHLALAAAIMASGALQLLPWLRRHNPTAHRWNGRFYILCALTMACSGFYLVLSGRKVVGDAPQHAALLINGLLILACGAMALQKARSREFVGHSRWALRLFLVVAGVWFFRIGLFLWLAVNQRPAGFNPDTFAGPFLTFLGFAQYLLPLTIFELYVRIRASSNPRWISITLAGVVALLTVMTGAGIAAAAMILWLPAIRGAV